MYANITVHRTIFERVNRFQLNKRVFIAWIYSLIH